MSKRYKSRVKTTQALHNVNLSVDRGEIVCVLGYNGAGKTTLVKSICGLLRPDEGAVRIGGRIVHEDLSFAHRKCGAVLEGSRNIYRYLTAYENLRYFGLLNGLSQKQIDRRADKYLRLFEMEPFRDVPASAFSRGMQQELSILITTHDVHLIEQLSSRLVFMRHGEIIRDSLLAELRRYKLNSLVGLLDVFLLCRGIFLGTGREFFPERTLFYALIGMVLWRCTVVCLQTACDIVQKEIRLGTLEQLLLARYSLLRIVVTRLLASAAFWTAAGMAFFRAALRRALADGATARY